MKISTKTTSVGKVEADILVLFVRQGKEPDNVMLSDEGKYVDRALHGDLARAMEEEKFVASVGSIFVYYTHGHIPTERVCVAGLGEKKTTVFELQNAVASAVRRAKRTGRRKVALALDKKTLEELGSERAGQAIAEAAILGDYTFLKHKSDKEKQKETSIEEVYILTAAGRLASVAAGAQRGDVVGQSVTFARDLVNEPPSIATPTYLADAAKNLAKGKKNISCEVFGKQEMEKMGMGGMLGIARGSDEEPKFIKLVYQGSVRKTICLVGKGITFDTGGLSLKPSKGMETMKLDMAGAATILGIFQALPILKPKVNVVGLLCTTENMPGPRAVKPGDIVRIMNGKSVEILNTDAEGRMVLADGLAYAAQKVKPDVLIDLATLTGACVVALGEEIAGLFSNDETLVRVLMDHAKAAGENVWQLPLVDEYREFLKSPIADLKNIAGGKGGGPITGALFLQEFVPEGTPWAHLDIAGPAFSEKDSHLTPRGGTGFGVRLLLNYLLSF